jgi:DHA2 family multidrug resistance protein
MTTTALTFDQDIWRPRYNPWLIAVVVALAAFMEVLDTSIANVALPYMAGDLGASNDQSTWVLTSYLVSNAIILPMTGWLAGAFGRRRFFMSCLAIFTASSLLCGLAPSLAFLLLFRVMQGAGGGGLQPMAQAILADTFPPEKRGLAFAAYGITAIIAPTIGPTLWGDGSRLTIPGAGFSLLTFRLAQSRGCWCGASSRTLLIYSGSSGQESNWITSALPF